MYRHFAREFEFRFACVMIVLAGGIALKGPFVGIGLAFKPQSKSTRGEYELFHRTLEYRGKQKVPLFVLDQKGVAVLNQEGLCDLLRNQKRFDR